MLEVVAVGGPDRVQKGGAFQKTKYSPHDHASMAIDWLCGAMARTGVPPWDNNSSAMPWA